MKWQNNGCICTRIIDLSQERKVGMQKKDSKCLVVIKLLTTFALSKG